MTEGNIQKHENTVNLDFSVLCNIEFLCAKRYDDFSAYDPSRKSEYRSYLETLTYSYKQILFTEKYSVSSVSAM